MLHRIITRSLACTAALLTTLLGGCDDTNPAPRELEIADAIADFDAAADDDDSPRPIAEILGSCAVDDDREYCDGATEKNNTTICYCGYVPGKGVVYVETDCAGYPGTHVCCAEACSKGDVGTGAG